MSYCSRRQGVFKIPAQPQMQIHSTRQEYDPHRGYAMPKDVYPRMPSNSLTSRAGDVYRCGQASCSPKSFFNLANSDSDSKPCEIPDRLAAYPLSCVI